MKIQRWLSALVPTLIVASAFAAQLDPVFQSHDFANAGINAVVFKDDTYHFIGGHENHGFPTMITTANMQRANTPFNDAITKQVQRSNRSLDIIKDMDYSLATDRLVTVSNGFRVFNGTTGDLVCSMKSSAACANVKSAIFSQGGNEILATCGRVIKLFLTSNCLFIKAFVGSPDIVHSVAISPNNVYSGSSGLLIEWTRSTSALNHVYYLPRNSSATIKSIALSDDFRTIAVGAEDGKIRVWRTDSAQPYPLNVTTLTKQRSWLYNAYNNDVNKVMIKEQGGIMYIVSAGGTEMTGIWKLSTKEMVANFGLLGQGEVQGMDIIGTKVVLVGNGTSQAVYLVP